MNDVNHLNATAIADTNYGLIQGILMLSLLNDVFYSFRGIPYAKPPLNELRFKVSALLSIKFKCNLWQNFSLWVHHWGVS